MFALQIYFISLTNYSRFRIERTTCIKCIELPFFHVNVVFGDNPAVTVSKHAIAKLGWPRDKSDESFYSPVLTY